MDRAHWNDDDDIGRDVPTVGDNAFGRCDALQTIQDGWVETESLFDDDVDVLALAELVIKVVPLQVPKLVVLTP